MSAAEATRPTFVLLAAEARARGFGGKHPTLAFRRWCKAHGVPITKDPDGRKEWVRPADVDRALAPPAPAEAPPANDAVEHAVAALMGRR